MLFKGSNRSEDYWISVSDLMAGLMIIFLFIAVSYMVKTQNENEMYVYIEQEYELAQDAIYKALFNEFENDLNDWNATIDKESLSFIFLSPDVLFETGKSDIQDNYKRILDDFFPRYIITLNNVLYPIQTFIDIEDKKELVTLQRSGKDNISAIRIEGHANKLAPAQYFTQNQQFVYNMKLSSDRAQSVLSYVLNLDLNDLQPWVRSYVRAVGYSSSNPAFTSDGQYDYERSKRVEFRIILDAQEKLFELIQKKKEGKLNEINYVINNDVLESQILEKFRSDLFLIKKELLDKEKRLSIVRVELVALEKDLNDLNIKKKNLLNEINVIENEKLSISNDIDRLGKMRKFSSDQLNKLENDISNLKQDIYDLTIDRDYYEDKIDELKATIDLRDLEYDKYLEDFDNGNYGDRDEFVDKPFTNNFSRSRKDDKDIILKPVLIGLISPIYPATALNANVGDELILSFIIDTNGKAKNIKVLSGKYTVFKKAAIEAIERAVWKPASKNGVPIDYPTRQTINFDPNN